MIRYVFTNEGKEILVQEAEKASLSPSTRLLNIACEFNLIPEFLRGRIREDQVYGIEINKEIVEKNPNILYCDVDHDPFPFPDETFDLVVSIFGIEHFREENVFKEAKRVLKQGGTFLFIVPNVLYPVFLINRFFGERFAQFYYQKVVQSSYRPHRAYYRFNSIGKIKRVATRAGFSSSDFTMLGPSNILLYVRRSVFAQRLVSLLDRVLTNPLLCGFKPYIIAVLKK